MKSGEVRNRFINYFTSILGERNFGHKEIFSSPLVPERHPSLLFTNSGMVQFTPYFIGEKDPLHDFGSNRLCSVQKCIRTGDLDVIGFSKYHVIFFEMLGSWSIGDYGKQKAVEFAFDLLTNNSYGFGLDPARFIPTVFSGNEEAPCDTETIKAWVSVGIPENKVSQLPASENWWAPAGLKGPGPCGPCTEVLYDRGPEFGPEEEIPGMTDNPRYIEIWNAGVFMQYNRDDKCILHTLDKLSVDTGAGLERITLLLEGVDSVYQTDLFTPIIQKIIDLGIVSSEKIDINNIPEIIRPNLYRAAEHIKSSTMLMSEKVYPSNKDQGYVVRRLIRTAFNDFEWKLGIDSSRLSEVVPIVFDMYKNIYPEMGDVSDVLEILRAENDIYKKVADNTRKYIVRNYVRSSHNIIDNPFDVYQSTGASKDLIESLAKEQNVDVDFSNFDNEMIMHQERSRTQSGQMFKGGLADNTELTVKYHTATHLLHQALREVIGDKAQQMGSNITSERLRFDFSCDEKVSEEDLQKVEDIVNEKIGQKLPVNSKIMNRIDAERTGALHFFKEKYGDEVKVYFIGNDIESAWSREFCGGPHVNNTSELGHFKIQKEEGVGKGIRRIKAVLTS